MQGPRQIASLMFLALVLCASVQTSARAASLYGKVVAVEEGDTFTVFNLNRLVKIKLLGVDAPEKNQQYNDVARQHLADLILEKFVSVEYLGLGENNFILGTVFLKDMDVGLQMLRDGVAWFDKNASDQLSNSQSETYLQSELAARSERRGIWQEKSPTPPWEFNAQDKAKRFAARNSRATEKRPANAQVKPSLSSDDLLRGLVGSPAGAPVARSVSAPGEDGWRTLAPSDAHFSASVPVIGWEVSKTVAAGPNDLGSIDVWFSDYDSASYLVAWMKGPNLNYTDSSAIAEGAKGLVVGLNRGFVKRGLNLVFEATKQRDLKLDGYAGEQYSVAAAGVPGVIRVFSKQFGKLREIYLIGVFNRSEEDPTVAKFLQSLSLNRKP